MTVRLKVLSWNVKIGHPVDDVIHQLRSMIDEHDPDVIILYEARRLHGHLNHLGYEVSQLKTKSARRGYRPATSNVAILTHNGLKHDSFVMRMHTYWRGPHLGAPQSPRVYRWIRLEKFGSVWRIGGFHIPFGSSARFETFSRIRGWFSKAIPGKATIAFGDYNSNKATITKVIAKQVGAKVAGEGIDLTVYKNCRLISSRNLGHHGSDHPVLLYLFEKVA